MPLFLCSLPLPFPSLTLSGTLSGHGRQSEYAKLSFFLWESFESSIGPDVESVVDGSLRRRIHRTAHISALPCVGEEPVLPSNHEWFHGFPFTSIVTEGKPAVHEIGHPIVLHRQGIGNGGSEKGFPGYLCGDVSDIADEFVELRFDRRHPLLLQMLAERQWSSECGSWYSG